MQPRVPPAPSAARRLLVRVTSLALGYQSVLWICGDEGGQNW